MQLTRILATIGPACDNRDTIARMVESGLSGVRINTAHVDPSYVSTVRNLTDSVNSNKKSHIAILLDLKGPELRVGDLSEDLQIKEGRTYELSENGIPVNRETFFTSLKHGNRVVMSDGKIVFNVIEASSRSVKLKALTSGKLRKRARINVPGVKIDLGTLTERDLQFIAAGTKEDVDFYALSFVQSREDMWNLQNELISAGSSGKTVSKIETKRGYSDIRAIVHASDMVMVARGDLGVEMPLSEVAMAQKRIISEAHKQGIPAIVATQMLESMVENNSPTRAEVSDVTNAILDNCDVVMLSEETAIGKHPIEAVSYLAKISSYVEKEAISLPEPDEFFGNQIAFSVCKAAKVMSSEISSRYIVCFTKNGNTARMLSALRPASEIVAVVTTESLARKLNLVRGVSISMLPKDMEKASLLDAMASLKPPRIFKQGEDLVVVSGAPYFLFGVTNDVRVVTMGEFIGRGYADGKSLKGIIKHSPDTAGDILISDNLTFNPGSGTKAVVTTAQVPASLMEELRESNITIVSLAQFSRHPKDGEKVFVNGETGVIISLESGN